MRSAAVTGRDVEFISLLVMRRRLGSGQRDARAQQQGAARWWRKAEVPQALSARLRANQAEEQRRGCDKPHKPTDARAKAWRRCTAMTVRRGCDRRERSAWDSFGDQSGLGLRGGHTHRPTTACGADAVHAKKAEQHRQGDGQTGSLGPELADSEPNIVSQSSLPMRRPPL